MAERLNTPERGETSPESVDNGAAEREALRLERERAAAEKGPEKNVESLRDAAEKAAEREKKKESADKTPKAEKRRDTPAQRRAKASASYKKTMKETQAHMKPTERAFSKVIHNPVVEKTSEAVGATIARPNAILSGSVCAFLLTLGLYLFAKHYGYPLSGFETIAAFILGWAVGLLFDYLRVMISGRNS